MMNTAVAFLLSLAFAIRSANSRRFHAAPGILLELRSMTLTERRRLAPPPIAHKSRHAQSHPTFTLTSASLSTCDCQHAHSPSLWISATQHRPLVSRASRLLQRMRRSVSMLPGRLAARAWRLHAARPHHHVCIPTEALCSPLAHRGRGWGNHGSACAPRGRVPVGASRVHDILARDESLEDAPHLPPRSSRDRAEVQVRVHTRVLVGVGLGVRVRASGEG